MRILLTSGGTKVPIDSVRHIANMSHGTFGSKIATELLKDENVELTFLYAEHSRTPFKLELDLSTQDAIGSGEAVEDCYFRYSKVKSRYRQESYRDFIDYYSKLERHVCECQPDIVVLAAAVSDYLVGNKVNGKIRSDSEMLITLTPAPKLIGMIKEWYPKCKLVGFKLLVGSTDKELCDAALSSIEKNGCDLVVANDLRDIKALQQRALLVTAKTTLTVSSSSVNPNAPAMAVAERILAL